MPGISARDTARIIAGRYELEELLGQGGMGEVWRARHLALKSHVALKLLHGAVASDPTTRERFLTEAQITASLKSRHAVQVFDFGVTEEGQPYLVMELVEGEALDRRIARELRLPRADTVKLLGRAARALDRAHALGIVHRDFKPENIMIFSDEDGGDDVKVVDFGVAKLLGELEAENERTGASPLLGHHANKARTQNLVGTPYYMSPEQINDPSRVGPPADIWAFGVVAYECLTGARPFEDETVPGLMRRILRGEPVARGSDLAHLPKEFDEWFTAACQPDPALRFPDAQTALTALAVVLDVPAPAPLRRGGDRQRKSLPDIGATVTPSVRTASFSDTVDARASSGVQRSVPPERSSLAAATSASGAPAPVVKPPPKRGWKVALAAVAVAVVGTAVFAMRSSDVDRAAVGAAPSAAPIDLPRAPEPSATNSDSVRGAAAQVSATTSANATSATSASNAHPINGSGRGAVGHLPPGRAAAKASAAASAQPSAAPIAPIAPPPPTPPPASSSPFQLPPLGL